MLEKIHDEEKNQISKVYQNKNERKEEEMNERKTKILIVL
jgi:hypothetical protein